MSSPVDPAVDSPGGGPSRGRPFGTARLLWAEARPPVQVIFLLRFLVGVALFAEGRPVLAEGGSILWIVPAAVGWLLVTFATYLGNGVADVVEDRCNGSRRPIASGRVEVRLAVRVTVACFVAGVVLSAWRHPVLGLLAAALAVLGAGYSFGPRPFKRTTPATISVVVVAGLLTYLAGGVAGGAHVLSDGRALSFAVLMSSWMAVGGLAKDLSDVEGDRVAGRRTLAVRAGVRTARCAVAAAAVVVAQWGLWSAVRHPSLWPVVIVLGVGVGCLLVQVGRLRSASRGDLRRPYATFMVTQYVTHLTAIVVLC